jgi:hypothetical protein
MELQKDLIWNWKKVSALRKEYLFDLDVEILFEEHMRKQLRLFSSHEIYIYLTYTTKPAAPLPCPQ